jgi:hypothetical protein
MKSVDDPILKGPLITPYYETHMYCIHKYVTI